MAVDVCDYEHPSSLQLGGASILERRLFLLPSATSQRLSRDYGSYSGVADRDAVVLEHEPYAEHRGPVVIVEESRSHSIHGTRIVDATVDIESQ